MKSGFISKLHLQKISLCLLFVGRVQITRTNVFVTGAGEEKVIIKLEKSRQSARECRARKKLRLLTCLLGDELPVANLSSVDFEVAFETGYCSVLAFFTSLGIRFPLSMTRLEKKFLLISSLAVSGLVGSLHFPSLPPYVVVYQFPAQS
jgi:hypothetical protein